MRNIILIEDSEWDELVVKTYGKPYCFQQQDDCKDRGTERILVPDKNSISFDDEMNDSIPETDDPSSIMGVKFQVWLDRDPLQLVLNDEQLTYLYWHRNFYPNVNILANDMYEKGILEEGEYLINIDW